MENSNDVFLRFKKILVALDASPQSIHALETGAKLACALKVRLKGLFVEDIDILKLCESPIAQEIHFFSFRRNPAHRKRLEYQLKIMAEKINKKIADIASKLSIPWDFMVTRGGVASEILSAAEEADLVILGKSGWSKETFHIGSTAQNLIFKGKGNILILGKTPSKGAPIFLFFFNTPLFKKALELSILIKQDQHSPIVIIIPTTDINQGIVIRDSLKKQLKESFKEIFFRIIEVREPSDISVESSILREGWFVIPWDSTIVPETSIKAIISQAKGSILIVKN